MLAYLFNPYGSNLLFLQHKQNDNRWNLFIKRLLADPDDVFRFNDKMLVSQHRRPQAMILQLAERLRPALERPILQHGVFPVVVQFTNALCVAQWDKESSVSC